MIQVTACAERDTAYVKDAVYQNIQDFIACSISPVLGEEGWAGFLLRRQYEERLRTS
jgi:hypothetical protein